MLNSLTRPWGSLLHVLSPQTLVCQMCCSARPREMGKWKKDFYGFSGFYYLVYFGSDWAFFFLFFFFLSFFFSHGCLGMHPYWHRMLTHKTFGFVLVWIYFPCVLIFPGAASEQGWGCLADGPSQLGCFAILWCCCCTKRCAFGWSKN